MTETTNVSLLNRAFEALCALEGVDPWAVTENLRSAILDPIREAITWALCERYPGNNSRIAKVIQRDASSTRRRLDKVRKTPELLERGQRLLSHLQETTIRVPAWSLDDLLPQFDEHSQKRSMTSAAFVVTLLNHVLDENLVDAIMDDE